MCAHGRNTVFLSLYFALRNADDDMWLMCSSYNLIIVRTRTVEAHVFPVLTDVRWRSRRARQGFKNGANIVVKHTNQRIMKL